MCTRVVSTTVVALVIALLFAYSDPGRRFLLDESRLNADARGKIIVITGATKGIGRQLSLLYAAAGAKLLLVARTQNALEEVSKRALELGAQSTEIIAVDLGTKEGCEEVVSYAASQQERIDMLILNHIIGYWGDWITEFREKEYFEDLLFRVNVLGYTRISMPLLPHLERSKGRLVVVSSAAAKIASPKTAPYAMTKSAVQAFFESLRQDLYIHKSNVSITICVLGNIASKNALKNTKGDLQHLAWSGTRETAVAIAKAAALRFEVLHFPYFELASMIILRSIVPSFADWLTRMIVRPYWA
mmetsp:Transcript_57/g.128  ORF Transcript_57/g.128 Transcript_57/m.128 type:complete len:302 (+) Transcript_57:159-1064(+)